MKLTIFSRLFTVLILPALMLLGTARPVSANHYQLIKQSFFYQFSEFTYVIPQTLSAKEMFESSPCMAKEEDLQYVEIPESTGQIAMAEEIAASEITLVETEPIVIDPKPNSPIEPVVSAQPTATPEPLARPVPTAKPEPVVTQPTALDSLFEQYAAEYGVSAQVLKDIAQCESGMNASATNGPYGGMFQFSGGTWASNRKAMGLDHHTDLRFNAEESIKTAAFKISRDGVGAWPACGRRATATTVDNIG